MQTGVVVGSAAWIAPSVLTLDHVAAAVGSCAAEVPVASNGALLIAPPATTFEGTPILDSNSNTFAWVETEAEILDNPLTVNRTTAGNFNGASDQGSIIAAGTEIHSYYIHGDHLNDSGQLLGRLTFTSAQIIGLIYRATEMTASSFLRNPGTNYADAKMEGSDTMTLDLTPGANAISWDMRFGGALDGMRVITSCA
jgi:hypothetical protein